MLPISGRDTTREDGNPSVHSGLLVSRGAPMRRRRTRSLVVVAAAAALAGAIALPASPAGATSAVSMTVTPSTNLSDGDSVAVSATGISGTPRLSLFECNRDASMTYAQISGGYCKLLSQPAYSNGGFSTSVKVIYGSLYGDPTGGRCDETATGQCVIALTDDAGQTVLAATPVSFKPLSIAMTVTPDTGLKDGQQVTVTVDPSTVPASFRPLTVAQCNTAYMATHNGFGGGGCGFASVYDFDPTKPVTLTIVDGKSLQSDDAICGYANNGDCAIVLAATNGYTPVVTHPIKFRTPITGAAATIVASPTTGLHGGTPGTVSLKSGAIADHMEVVYVAECRDEAVGAATGTDWFWKACAIPAKAKVVGNSMSPTAFNYIEGGVGGTGTKPCDHTHACEIGLVGKDLDGQYVLLSNWIPISFRPANYGTPTLTLSKYRGLEGGDTVSFTATDVPDMVRALYMYECNVKGGYDKNRCRMLYAKPGDHGAATVHDNPTKGTLKVKSGAVGSTNTGKKVYCNAKTNGQCVLVAVTYPYGKYRIKSGVIRFAP